LTFKEDFSLKTLTKEQQHNIGFDFVMAHLLPLTCYGKERKQQIIWYSPAEKPVLIRELQQLQAFKRFFDDHPEGIATLSNILERFKEIRGIIRKINAQAEPLDEVEFFQLKNFSIDCQHLWQAVEELQLSLLDHQLCSLHNIVTLLNPDEQINRTFTIDSRYSQKLAQLREAKKTIEKQITAQTKPDNHLLNLHTQLTEQERKAEHQVCQQLTDQLRCSVADIINNTSYLSELDFLIAKARLADTFGAVAPQFTDTETIDINEAVNPWVNDILNKEGKSFSPLTLSLKQGANVLTGANMGGKTIALATLTLNILLAHCGFFVFCRSLSLPALDFLFYLAHDYQSVTAGISSFGAEVQEITRLIKEMDNARGFAAVDEFARDTNPEEGQTMVRTLLRLCEKHNSFCLLSTHFSHVVDQGMQHLQVVGLQNAPLEALSPVRTDRTVNHLQEMMDFTIEAVPWDNPTPKDAIRVARLIGIPQEFLDLLDEETRENVVGNQTES
jgi:dsDNA-specific endonuclease/ATPase MutS2